MKIGSHVSIVNGLKGAVEIALSYNANTFMVYTGAPNNTIRKNIKDMLIEEGLQLMKENNIEDFVVHAPYILNLATFKEDLFNNSVSFLKSEIDRTEKMGSKNIVVHPGAFTSTDLNYGLKKISEGLNLVLENDNNVNICLETMAGKGTEIGRNFQELAQIYDKVRYKEKIKFCFDTCHVHDSGYDIVNDLEDVMRDFEINIGTNLIEIFHINGSLNERGKRKDRHANIGADSSNSVGEDKIGFEAIYKLAHSKYAKNKFLILETPWTKNNQNLYKEEIAKLRGDLK